MKLQHARDHSEHKHFRKWMDGYFIKNIAGNGNLADLKFINENVSS